MRLALPSALLVLSAVPLAHPQTSTPDLTGTVTGRVFCGDTGQPARFARVSVQPVQPAQAGQPATASRPPAHSPPSTAPATLSIAVDTALDGTFTLTHVQPGSFYVVVEKEGYINPRAMFTGKEIENPTPEIRAILNSALPRVDVEPGHTDHADVRLERGAAVSGTVLFDDGSPAGEMPVKLLHKDESGKWVPLSGYSRKFGAGINTDDRGHFRMSSLLPDTYLLQVNMVLADTKTSVSNVNGRQMNFAMASDRFTLPFYGAGTPHQEDAAPFKLLSGDEFTAGDMTLPISKLHRLTGRVAAGPDAHFVNAASLELVMRDGNRKLASSTISREDGLFHFEFVPDGDYILRASNARDVAWEQPRPEPGSTPSPNPFPQPDVERVLEAYGGAEQPVLLRGDQLGLTLIVPPGSTKNSTNPKPAKREPTDTP